MKTAIVNILLVLLLISEYLYSNQTYIDIYVSISGNDQWSGRIPEPNHIKKDGPIRSIYKALDIIRNIQVGTDYILCTIYIREGQYELNKTIDLNDTIYFNKMIHIKGYKNEKVSLIGGKKISKFDKIKNYHGKIFDSIWQANLSKLGINNFGEMNRRGHTINRIESGAELFLNGKAIVLARWPNDKWLFIDDIPQGRFGGCFTYSYDRPRLWEDSRDIWVHGYWCWEYSDSYERIQNIDKDKCIIYTELPHSPFGYSSGKRFYFLNIESELDSPGEWYLNRVDSVLYVWPDDSTDLDYAYVSMLGDIFKLDNMSDVVIDNLTIECCRGNGIIIKNGRNNVVNNCVIRNTGNDGVQIYGGINNGICNSTISQNGDCGIIIRGGDRKTLSSGGNFSINNHIFNNNRWCRTYCPAIQVEGVGNIIRNNLIEECPHSAVVILGNENIIEYNEFNNVCFETYDAGVIYIGRDPSQRGNQIRYNYFHNVFNSPVSENKEFHRVVGVYLDDFTCGTIVEENIFQKTDIAIVIGGGHDNFVLENLIINCNLGVLFDARGKDWARSYYNENKSILLEKLKFINFKSPPYSEKYPSLVNYFENNPENPQGNIIKNNISVNTNFISYLWGIDLDQNIVKNNKTIDELLNQKSSQTEYSLDNLYRNFKNNSNIPFGQIGNVHNEN